MRRFKPAVGVVATVLVLASCTGSSTTIDSAPSETLTTSATGGSETAATLVAAVLVAAVLVSERVDAIDEAIAQWRTAATIEEADAAAETAANLVVGPNGPGYGDRDGDGVIGGESAAGLLPGSDGTPAGLASSLSSNACVDADVLGGPWTDPTSRWEEMLDAIDEWRPDRNTMPSLASHPMRIVGWSTFTLGSDSLDLAHEYAGHAKLHVDISRRALDC